MSIQLLPPSRPIDPLRRRQVRDAVEAMVAESVVARSRWWRRRRWLNAGLGSLVLVVAGGGVTAYAELHTKPVTDRGQARCYTEATYGRGGHSPGTEIGEPNAPTRAGQVADALQVCAAMWRAGILQAGASVPIVHPGESLYPVPALVGCTLPDGTAAVFPGSTDTCARLGLALTTPPVLEPAEDTSAGPSPARLSP